MKLKSVLNFLNTLVESNPELLDYHVEVEAEDIGEDMQGITYTEKRKKIRFVGSDICYYNKEHILLNEGNK